VWDLGPDPDGGTRQAVLALSHHKGGAGQGHFVASLLNQTQDGPCENMGSPFDWAKISVFPAPRYSESKLAVFAELALAALRVKVAAGVAAGEETGMARYFQVQQ
jgi:hypothetical protein